MDQEYRVVVPVIGDRVLVNAVGSDETEATVNLDLIDLTDAELRAVEFRAARLVLE